MFELAVIGLIGGLVTGISPCILPVLPVVLAITTKEGRKPFPVVSGIAISFATITLIGTVLLNALGLPQSTLRWVGIILLVVVGLGMIVPAFGRLIEIPFQHIPRPTFLQTKARGKGGFLIGLALGGVYVPCAGPVLAAVTVAGATGEIGWSTVVLTVTFAIGASAPLLVFAAAGDRIGAMQNAFVQRIAGVVILVLAVALVFDAPAAVQRALPDWTSGVQRSISENERVQEVLTGASGGAEGTLEHCRNAGADTLNDCGKAPEFEGLEGWFNTDAPVQVNEGKVTLVDFWAYACINCQRANQHITKLYDTYKDAGLQVVGIHAPEYGFERELDNVKAAAKEQGIHYPVAQDNDFITWKKYNNRYWPAHYLVDVEGKVRQIHEGEGAYAETEQLVRELLTQANPNVNLPDPIEDGTTDKVTLNRNPETYLGTQRARFYTNQGYTNGVHSFEESNSKLDRFQYHLSGDWKLADDAIEPQADGARLTLDYHASLVQVVASGKGEITVTRADGSKETFTVPETPGTIDLVKVSSAQNGVLTIDADQGIRMYSLTFG
ncbi:MAG: cytochrome c biogenesis protein CcdA [Corynebacterium sp.]|nr:cytochrome c biogenesis protein CcdA [Corynebacterium sp.]